MKLYLLLAAAALLLPGQSPDFTPGRTASETVPALSGQQRLDLLTFETVWKTVRDKHWDPNLGGLDWQAVHDEFRPRVQRVRDIQELRLCLTEMLDRLKLSHYRIIPSALYSELNRDTSAAHNGVVGLDVRVLDGRAVVTSVDAASSAAANGVKPGWIIKRINSGAIEPVIRDFLEQNASSTLRDLTLRRAILSRLEGFSGDPVRVDFLDQNDQLAVKTMTRETPRGNLTTLGYLGPAYVWLDAKKIGGPDLSIERIAFNLFLDPAHLMGSFGDAVASCLNCDGMIIDLRGNPGGLGAMAMGMANWFVEKTDLHLGTLLLRDTALRFVLNPRPQTYPGPLAILVDGTSASTSEIFAGGLQDLKRARIFGTRTAAAALPSVIEKLPNGDAFQYAIANYISEGGKALEGNGVEPDVEAAPTRLLLLEGKDPALDAAVEWIRTQSKPRHE